MPIRENPGEVFVCHMTRRCPFFKNLHNLGTKSRLIGLRVALVNNEGPMIISNNLIGTRGLRGFIQHYAVLRKDSRCQKESNHQHLICRNFSSYINCWL